MSHRSELRIGLPNSIYIDATLWTVRETTATIRGPNAVLEPPPTSPLVWVEGPSRGSGRRGDSLVRGSDWIYTLPRPLTRPAGPDAQLTSSGVVHRPPAIRLGSTFCALLIVAMSVIALAAPTVSTVTGFGITAAWLIDDVLLVIVGYVAATTVVQLEPHLRRAGSHAGWRSTTALYVIATAAVAVVVPAMVLLTLGRWDALNRFVAGFGSTTTAGSQPNDAIDLSGGLDGVALVAVAATFCSLVPWLATANRRRLSPGQRALAIFGLYIGVGTIRLIAMQSLSFPVELITTTPSGEAVLLGVAVAVIPRSFIHRYPPRRLWLPALTIAGGALMVPSSLIAGAVASVAIYGATIAGFAVVLTADRLGLPSLFIGRLLETPGLSRMANHAASLLPAIVAWQSALAALTMGSGGLPSPGGSSLWVQANLVAAVVAISLVAAGLTRSRLIDPLRLNAVDTGATARTPASVHRFAQLEAVNGARFSSTTSTLWDEHLSQSVGKPLPNRPAVPIRTSTIVRRTQSTRTSHRGRRAKRDQLPPPERHRRASTEDQHGVRVRPESRDAAPALASNERLSHAEPSKSPQFNTTGTARHQ